MPQHHNDDYSTLWLAIFVSLLLSSASISDSRAEEPSGTRPLLTLGEENVASVLPPDTHLLIEAIAIEQFLD